MHRPDGCAAFHALLPLMKESSSAAKCLAGGLRSVLAATAALAPSAAHDIAGHTEGQVGTSYTLTVIETLNSEAGGYKAIR